MKKFLLISLPIFLIGCLEDFELENDEEVYDVSGEIVFVKQNYAQNGYEYIEIKSGETTTSKVCSISHYPEHFSYEHLLEHQKNGDGLTLGVRYYEEGTECGDYIKMFLVDIKHGYTEY